MFNKLTNLNLLSLISFLFAKLFGLGGVAFGFIESVRFVGGWLLIGAGILLFISIASSIIQLKKEQVTFTKEDEINKEIRDLKRENHRLMEKLRNQKQPGQFGNLQIRLQAARQARGRIREL